MAATAQPLIANNLGHTSEPKENHVTDNTSDPESSIRTPHWIPVITALGLAVAALTAAVVMTLLLPQEPAVFTAASTIGASGLAAAASVVLPRR